MLLTPLLHPDILRIAARCGHHAKILIADGNYPASTKKGPNAELVSLQLIPGVPTVAQVLRGLMSVVPFDAINTMGIPADDPYAKYGEPPVWKELRGIIAEARATVTIEPISKWDFYKAVESPDHVLTIQTADQALWANVLLTVGVRTNS
jgi:L-fucose mutarotase